MTTEGSLIPAEAKAMIGRQGPPETGYPVLEEEIRKYCYAYDDLNPLYLDPASAAQGPYGGIVAPPLFYAIPFPKRWLMTGLRPDGLPGDTEAGLRPVLPLTRNMFGGVEVEFHTPVRPGDVLTRQSRLLDIYERRGRTGPLIFTVTETRYWNQRGETVCVQKVTSIAR
ncbi:MAG: MaoC family dehydratase N-terminal domain-containing protein [Chloroflexi bacterium]|nr:MaoC family dehydratase N-terminal domain-containing protein [Chloroflexota bacterium]